MTKRSSNPQRPAPKTRFAKGQYYPKVDLSDVEDRLLSSWSSPGVAAPVEAPPAEAPAVAAAVVEAAVVEAESASEEEEVMSPPVAISQPPSAAAAPERTPSDATAPGPAKDGLLLPGCLDLPAARPLALSLLERRGQPIVIDAAAVSQIGAQCIQVLLAAKRTWEADGVSLSIVNCAPRVIEDLKLIGIDLSALVTGELPQ